MAAGFERDVHGRVCETRDVDLGNLRDRVDFCMVGPVGLGPSFCEDFFTHRDDATDRRIRLCKTASPLCCPAGPLHMLEVVAGVIHTRTSPFRGPTVSTRPPHPLPARDPVHYRASTVHPRRERRRVPRPVQPLVRYRRVPMASGRIC